MNILDVQCNSIQLISILRIVKNIFLILEIIAPILLIVRLVYTFIQLSTKLEEKNYLLELKTVF